ncbi:hypothetical protein P775_01290 [Puniceibacterium antarcticum]|uniref:VOC domain-containing protein n=1 Tax=Puniceibacterium antarcticum TaxID=1206336 RepID=A0A2G8RKV2_9RHOB|nr:VOC family protein [Puniceibacterium antarcticum]PIL22132.1 hypothetical protein P775_01290 [Puniceibacterium antarcticum]
MTHPVTGIDHVLIMGEDLDAAEAQYRRLGFTLSSRGMHPPAKGTANHTIMLQHDYVELLGILQQTDLNRPRFEAVKRDGPGLHAVCCRIEDAEAAALTLSDLGISTEVPNSFERAVPLADGTTGRAAFSTLNFRKLDVPVGLLFMCQHKTPETVWLPDLMRHANTATGISALKAVCAAPSAEAGRFARFWKDASVTHFSGGASVTTGTQSARLDLMERTTLEQRYPADWINATARGGYAVLQISVLSMGQVLECLERAGINSRATAEGHAVAPELAGGVILEFV